MRFLPYNKKLKDFSRHLRNHSTQGEILLWKELRARGMRGYQVYRQKPIENYIVDFYCPAVKLVIEVDGSYHNEEEQIIADEERQKILEGFQLNFLRFPEMDVRNKMESVLKAIESYILDYEEKNPQVKERSFRK